MKIDIFSHILSPKYMETMKKYGLDVKQRVKVISLWDLEERFRIMDKFDGLRQIVAPGGTPETKTTPSQEAELARIANDEVAEIVAKHPDRFAGAVALLPLRDIDETLKETDRVIKDLKFKGVHLPTPVLGKPVDRPEFLALYEKMCYYDLPIWLHPARPPLPEYPGEEKSAYDMFLLWGWPHESTLAMTRLVLSQVMEKYPQLKMIIHHAGAMIPFFSQRILNVYGVNQAMGREDHMKKFKHPILDYFRRFYVDTAINGNTPALMCACAFYGADHILFGTDFPYDAESGLQSTRETIKAVEGMDIPEVDKKKIFEGNGTKLLKL